MKWMKPSKPWHESPPPSEDDWNSEIFGDPEWTIDTKPCPVCKKRIGKREGVCLICMIEANRVAARMRFEQEEMMRDDPRSDWMPSDEEINEMAKREGK